jgi:hypothetical protein
MTKTCQIESRTAVRFGGDDKVSVMDRAIALPRGVAAVGVEDVAGVEV